MAIIPLRRHNRGLWVAPVEDEIPDGALRRATGVSPLVKQAITSRDGIRQMFAVRAHSIYRFASAWYLGAGDDFYRDTLPIILDGLTGDRLAFARMGPTSGIPDYLFVAGGGLLFKVDSEGTWTHWGISPPPDGMKFDSFVGLEKEIDYCETNNWSPGDAGITIVRDTSEKYQGTSSVKITASIPRVDATVRRTFTTAINLTEYGADEESGEGDYIHFALKVNDSLFITACDYMRIEFKHSDGLTSFYKDIIFASPGSGDLAGVETAGRTVGTYDPTTGGICTEITVMRQQRFCQNIGGQEVCYVLNLPQTVRVCPTATRTSGGNVAYAYPTLSWQLIKIKKESFVKNGEGDWSSIKSIVLYTRTLPLSGLPPETPPPTSLSINIDYFGLAGGYALEGDYKYLVTFANTTTGTRSNSNPTPLEVKNVLRQGVQLKNIPISTDSQVDRREIWRTTNGGSIFFLAGAINDNETTTYLDTAADYPGWDSDTYLSSEMLPTDNTKPFSWFDDCYGPWNASMWWITRSQPGKRGFVYYSPIGRAEGVQGYLIATSDDDPLQKLVAYKGSLFVVSVNGWFEIMGQNPYTVRKISGCPGTTKPFCVVETPSGIVYEAHDGIRIFDGYSSRLLGMEQLQSVFRGRNEAAVESFHGVVACYARGEYFISNLFRTLAYSLSVDSWRDIGLPCEAFHWADDTDQIAATILTDFDPNAKVTSINLLILRKNSGT
jgi:hypothetical protein